MAVRALGVRPADVAGQLRRAPGVVAAWLVVLLLTPAVAHGLTAAPLRPDQGLAITGSQITGAPLFPGATGDVTFTVRNRNDHAVRVDRALLTGVRSTSHRGCSRDHFTLHAGVVRPTTIGPGSSATVVVVGGLGMATTAPEDCRGVTIRVAATLSGSRV